MSNKHELRATCRGYRKGDWEPLAVVCGDIEIQARLEHSLTFSAIRSAAAQAAIIPTRIYWRVEALASIAPNILSDLSKTWPDPISLNPLSGLEDALFIEAWTTSFRHLHRIDAIESHKLNAVILQQELELLPQERPNQSFSWSSLLEDFSTRFMNSWEIRKFSSGILLDKVLTGSDLKRCLEIPRSQISGNIMTQRSPLHILRVLRGRTGILDS